jgi:hypothetical protein
MINKNVKILKQNNILFIKSKLGKGKLKNKKILDISLR